MVLESTIVCVDNSEFSRNGDFSPSRFAAQVDSVVTLCNSKVRSNPESTVGLLTMAGRSARILVTSTRDVDQVFSCMHDVKYDGCVADFVAGIQKAQLALKHRQNTMQRQRIVVFVSSPISAPVEKLVQLGKKLKKNQVAVDVINIGKEGENTEKIDAFLQAVNANDNSRALHVDSSGPSLPDSLMNSAIYADRDSGAASGGGSGGESATNNFPFGVDPDQDPELAMVLRISMEEERARQEAAARSNPGQSSEQAGEPASAAAKPAADAEYDDDDDLYGSSDQKDKMEVDASGSAGPSGASEEDDELDEETRRAIELSKIDFESPPDNSDDKN